MTKFQTCPQCHGEKYYTVDGEKVEGIVCAMCKGKGELPFDTNPYVGICSYCKNKCKFYRCDSCYKFEGI